MNGSKMSRTKNDMILPRLEQLCNMLLWLMKQKDEQITFKQSVKNRQPLGFNY